MSFLKKLKVAFKGEYDNYTEGSINLAIFMLAVPMIFEMMGESLFSVADAYFVGKLGSYALSTVGLTESILFIIYSIAMGLSAAVTALVARRVGEKNPEAAADVTFQAIILSVIMSGIISLIGIFYSVDLLALMGATKETIDKGTGYITWMLVGNFPILFLFMLNGTFRGAGNASIAMWSLIIGNVANVILDPIFIFGWGFIPEMGLTGAAIASVIGRSLGVVYQAYYLQHKKSIVRIGKKNLKLHYDSMKQIISIATGGVFQFFVSSVSWVILIRITTELGQQAVAAYTIAYRVIIFTLLPSWGVANATATLVGQNLGAGNTDRAEKTVWRAAHINAIFLVSTSVFFFLFSEQMAMLFSTELEVIREASLGLQIMAAGYIFYGYGMILSQAFNGAGDTYTPMMINIVAFIVIQSPVAYILAINYGWGDSGIYASIAIANSISAVLAMIIFNKGKWKKVVV